MLYGAVLGTAALPHRSSRHAKGYKQLFMPLLCTQGPASWGTTCLGRAWPRGGTARGGSGFCSGCSVGLQTAARSAVPRLAAAPPLSV